MNPPRPVANQNFTEPDFSALPAPKYCLHCGFPVRSVSKKSSEPDFCCYGCVFAHQIVSGGSEGKTVSWILVKLGIAAFLAMNVMGFALALHSSSIYPDFYEQLGQGGRAYDELLRYLLFFMSAPVLFLIGVPLYENIIHEARAGRWGVDGFIGGSVLAAFAYSMVNTFRGSGPLYYDIAVMVLVFLTLGRYLEARFRFKAAKSLEHLLEDEKPNARKVTAAGEEAVSAEALCVGDQVHLAAGCRVPVDGVIEEGRGVLELAPMTGEFLPVAKTAGDAVWAGAYLTEGFLKIRVTHRAEESWTARLKQTLQTARNSKAPIEFFADRIVFVMTLSTLMFAAAGFYFGNKEHGVMAGVLRSLAVLVIICPCALGAAIPLALWKSFESIAARGILFKDLGRLEILAKVKGVFFDKTGTLTEPQPRLSSIVACAGESEAEILSKAASAAKISDHPFSKALVREAAARRLKLEAHKEIFTSAGEGLSCVLESGIKVLIGNLKFMESNKIGLEHFRSRKNSEAFTLAAWEGRLRGIFEFSEKERAEAREAVKRLQNQNMVTGILTGDASASAAKLSADLKLEAVTGLSPQEKLEWVRNWEGEHGPALVVGEGLNDAPMLAGAGVSLAVGGALEKTRDAADFALPDNNLNEIPWLLQTAKATMKKIKGNLFWAFFYNVLAVPLAVSGKINPVAAALLMIFSSVFIIVRSLAAEPPRVRI